VENQMDNLIIFEKYCKVIVKQKVEKSFPKKINYNKQNTGQIQRLENQW